MSDAPALPPASGAWREGDPVGDRQFAELGRCRPRAGRQPAVGDGRLRDLGRRSTPSGPTRCSCCTRSPATPTSPAPAGPGHPTPGWWDGLVGPGAPIDTDRWFVVAPNVLGGCQGTTGPVVARPGRAALGLALPAHHRARPGRRRGALADALGIDALGRGGRRLDGRHAGAGVGGRASRPGRVGAAVLAVGAVATADQIGDADRADRGDHARTRAGAAATTTTPHPATARHVGLGIARRIAHLTYRSELELQTRFGSEPQEGEDPLAGGRFAVQSYLDHQAGQARCGASTPAPTSRSRTR